MTEKNCVITYCSDINLINIYQEIFIYLLMRHVTTLNRLNLLFSVSVSFPFLFIFSLIAHLQIGWTGFTFRFYWLTQDVARMQKNRSAACHKSLCPT